MTARLTSDLQASTESGVETDELAKSGLGSAKLVPSQATIDFMLSEMDRLAESRIHADQLAEGRLNVLISITTAAAGILLLFSQLQLTGLAFWEAASIVFGAIWLFGLVTVWRMLRRNVAVVLYLRGLNRARRFFVDLDPAVKPYLAFPYTDSEPHFTTLGARRNGARMIATLISSLAFALTCIGSYCVLTRSLITPLERRSSNRSA